MKELLSHIFVVMVSGFDSPSTVLPYCLHTLAHRIDIQKKLLNEILTHNVTQDNLSDLIYLDAFIKEVLRMHPTAVQFVHRRCTEDTVVNGYRIPAGRWINHLLFSSSIAVFVIFQVL